MPNRVDWDEAFDVYVAEDLSYQQVADRLGVTKRTIGRGAKRLNWPGRRQEIRRKARERQAARLVRTLAERNADTIKIVEAARTRFASQLADRDKPYVLTGAELVGLLKVEQLLEGQATSRVVGLDVTRLQQVLEQGIVSPEQVEAFIEVWRALQLGEGPIIDGEVLEIEAGDVEEVAAA